MLRPQPSRRGRCDASGVLWVRSNPVRERTYNVLFVCTGNSARSIMAEVLLNSMGAGRFRAYSAGSHPKGKVHPVALKLIQKNRLPIEGLRSKSWDEFARPDAPPLDFVFTVCDDAAGEVCPVWSGQPVTAHWGIPDPAAATGTDAEIEKAFVLAFEELQRRISLFTSLHLESHDREALQKHFDEMGRTPG
jgi:arsenate reductase (thioredoxin)